MPEQHFQKKSWMSFDRMQRSVVLCPLDGVQTRWSGHHSQCDGRAVTGAERPCARLCVRVCSRVCVVTCVQQRLFPMERASQPV